MPHPYSEVHAKAKSGKKAVERDCAAKPPLQGWRQNRLTVAAYATAAASIAPRDALAQRSAEGTHIHRRG